VAVCPGFWAGTRYGCTTGVDEGAAPSLCSARDWEEEMGVGEVRGTGGRGVGGLRLGARSLSSGTICESFSGTDSDWSKIGKGREMQDTGEVSRRQVLTYFIPLL